MVKRPRRTIAPRSTPIPVMQIRRTRTPNNPPDLLPGQLGVEMADDPPRLWVGVPETIDVARRRELLASAPAIGGWNGEVVGYDLKVEAGGWNNRGILRVVRAGGGYIKHNGQLYLIPVDGFWWQQAPAP